MESTLRRRARLWLRTSRSRLGFTFVTVDVTAAVQNWVGGVTPNNGFLIQANVSTDVHFDSKESITTSQPAMLSIVLASSGSAGPAGPTGPQGLTGPAGAQGAAGTAGAAGARGATGPQGVAGATGPQGVAGAAGARGATGPQGVAGATGPQGVAGASGPQGVAGAAGARGATGPQGVAGATGPQGAVGATGAQGPAGATGPQGLMGPAGPQGWLWCERCQRCGSSGTNRSGRPSRPELGWKRVAGFCRDGSSGRHAAAGFGARDPDSCDTRCVRSTFRHASWCNRTTLTMSLPMRQTQLYFAWGTFTNPVSTNSAGMLWAWGLAKYLDDAAFGSPLTNGDASNVCRPALHRVRGRSGG